MKIRVDALDKRSLARASESERYYDYWRLFLPSGAWACSRRSARHGIVAELVTCVSQDCSNQRERAFLSSYKSQESTGKRQQRARAAPLRLDASTLDKSIYFLTP